MKTLLGVIAVAALTVIAACGGDKLQTSLSLEDAYCPQGKDLTGPAPEVLKINEYRITISGEDFEPITVTLDGKTASSPVEDIPKGENRTLLIEALNNRGQVICRRELTGIAIKGGKIALVEISLLAVPFVANISDNNIVTATRLTFDGYGEPVGAVQIIDTFSGTETVLKDVATDSELVSPSSTDATFKFKPLVLPIGEHVFTVRDFQTGEQSQVKVTLVAPGREPGRGFQMSGLRDAKIHATGGRASDSFAEVLEEINKY